MLKPRIADIVAAVAAIGAVAGPMAFGLFSAPAGRAQSPAGSFEVASIKLSTGGPGDSSGIKTGHGLLNGENVTLKRCIIGAWGVGPHQIVGGPDWLDVDRFVIAAKAARPVDDDRALMLMLQSLLAERFKLSLHRETRVMPAFVLEVAKGGPKLEKAPDGESGTNVVSSNTGVSIKTHNTSMEAFAKILARSVDLPVVDHTGLEGVFNFKLEWTPESVRQAKAADGAADGPSLFTALQEQLGLRLRSQKAPVEVLVIDHADKPTAN